MEDRSIAALSGVSQALLAANRGRRYLLIQNTGSANIGVNLVGGAAVIGGLGTITLAAGGSFECDAEDVVTNAMTVIGTAAQPVACFEGGS